MSNIKEEACELLREALNELEAPKGSVLSGVQKLLRAARITGEEDISIWCEIHLGKQEYTLPLQNYLYALFAKITDKSKETKELDKARKELKDVGITDGFVERIDCEEALLLCKKEGGGFSGIGFIEEQYADLVKTKRGNNGEFYKDHLLERINGVRRVASDKATTLYRKLAFSEPRQTTFDYLREEVDDKLMDLNPELAEKLMIAFKSVASENPEEWSHALTTCRRLIEELANELFPASEELVNGRKLGQAQYVNRLWAFMGKAIESESNRELAKAHVDLLGTYLERINKLTNKGVHAALTKLEGVKSVFHTYLMLADILQYLEPVNAKQQGLLNIHTATLDELESILGISRAMAKEVIKLRVKEGALTPETLRQIHRIGLKTIAKAKELFSFEPAK